MKRLATPIESMRKHYTVVVVGSGYGGGIAASRLARAEQQVCVLERGRELLPGEYPETQPEALREMQVRAPHYHTGSPTALFDFHIHEDISVLVGCGLGGTSLINAGVTLQADPRVFQDRRWPDEVREDLHTRLADGYRRAEEMLRPTPYPEHMPRLPKLDALERSAAAMGACFSRPPINVSFESGVNHVGVEQHACTLCGDCVAGCNVGAKNTTLMNYLPDAHNHGAELFTRVRVERVERREDRWAVYFEWMDAGHQKMHHFKHMVTADVVILAAGTLGSTEILLRSRGAGLDVSDQLGERFTGNGDVLGFGYNTEVEINGVGFGDGSAEEIGPVGPTITGMIDLRSTPRLSDAMVIQEASIPSAIAPGLAPAFTAATTLVGREMHHDLPTLLRERERELLSLRYGAYHGAIHNTQTYLAMSHDEAAGRLRLRDGALRIEWPRAGEGHIFQRVNEVLTGATAALGGDYLRNPTWSRIMRHGLVTAHPLGGCVMASCAEFGVVNHKGQVFSDAQGDTVYEGLYVSDGSVIPRPLGVNPLFTISALAERCCALLAEDRGWHIDYSLPSLPAVPEQHLCRGIRFSETMKGFVSLGDTAENDSFEMAGQTGDGSPLQFVVTIISRDLDAMIHSPEHRAAIIGSATAPGLSDGPMAVSEGEFNLFIQDQDHPGSRKMVYRMKLTSQEGAIYFLEGFKRIQHGSPVHLWSETTTLYVTLREGSSTGPVTGKGILRIHPEDFLKQLTTLEVSGAASRSERLQVVSDFGRFFFGKLYESYGAIHHRPTEMKPDAAPRVRRTLRVGAPEVHFFHTDDGVLLRLTRYRGGSFGPVVLGHGVGVSSAMFAVDTIETSLVEYLCAHGFDVWLLDWRGSVALDASRALFTCDDVADYDFPAAIRLVRELTGASSVDMVVHCVASITLFMSMLSGLEGVRSILSTQVATDMVVPAQRKAEAGLYLPTVLKRLGIDALDAGDEHETSDRQHREGWAHRLYDRAVALNALVEAQGRCNDAACHRATFMYGSLFPHEQLNEATHATIHELFGETNIRMFEHLALLCRRRRLVAADGADRYLPNLDRLRLPITLLHGERNECWLPETTARTYRRLCKENGPDLYRRHVVPGYGHMDCLFGKNASRDVYPLILEHLDRVRRVNG